MSLKIYTESNSSSRKVVKWLNDHDVEFIEVRLKTDALTKQEMKGLLSFTDNGLSDLLKRTTQVNFDDLPLSRAIDRLIADPRPLKSPILFDGKKLRIGFNEDKIRCFIPRRQRLLTRIG